ncbi:hypothetical protein SAMN06272771_5011 [Streptomyces sp. Ag82_O1-12]|nr:hypothetical protein SAMN06272771_5011 [Streptomyces sp. Ag82_O1-12]SOD47596.1 hypothetical protein SAMN06272727_5012 [Streptomyces sp. Ag82_G6-1]
MGRSLLEQQALEGFVGQRPADAAPPAGAACIRVGTPPASPLLGTQGASADLSVRKPCTTAQEATGETAGSGGSHGASRSSATAVHVEVSGRERGTRRPPLLRRHHGLPPAENWFPRLRQKQQLASVGSVTTHSGRRHDLCDRLGVGASAPRPSHSEITPFPCDGAHRLPPDTVGHSSADQCRLDRMKREPVLLPAEGPRSAVWRPLHRTCPVPVRYTPASHARLGHRGLQRPHSPHHFLLGVRVSHALRIHVDAPRPAGQRGEEPGKVLRAAIQPIVRDANDTLDRLTTGRASGRQRGNQGVETRPWRISLRALRPLSVYAATIRQPCSPAVRSLIRS